MKGGYESERERQILLQSQGWHVTRNSGSIGATDLIAVKVQPTSLLFSVRYEQIKSCKAPVFYFDALSRWELERLKKITEDFLIPCYWVIKFKRQGWKTYDARFISGAPLRFINNKTSEIELEKTNLKGNEKLL